MEKTLATWAPAPHLDNGTGNVGQVFLFTARALRLPEAPSLSLLQRTHGPLATIPPQPLQSLFRDVFRDATHWFRERESSCPGCTHTLEPKPASTAVEGAHVVP